LTAIGLHYKFIAIVHGIHFERTVSVLLLLLMYLSSKAKAESAFFSGNRKIIAVHWSASVILESYI